MAGLRFLDKIKYFKQMVLIKQRQRCSDLTMTTRFSRKCFTVIAATALTFLKSVQFLTDQ